MNTKNSGRGNSRPSGSSSSKGSGAKRSTGPSKKPASPFSKGTKKDAAPAAKRGPAKSAKPEPQKPGGVSARDKRKYIDFKEKVKKGDPLPSFNEDEIRLNKYLSNAGICSRREADVLIQTGVITVNGEMITELG